MKPTKVLVVDDEFQVRRLLRRLLEKLGHQAVEADDGSGVAELVRRERPDLALMDIHMPRLDGIAALSQALEADPGLAVIMVTADLDLERVQLALERGASEYITKPFDLEALERSITSNLERQSARRKPDGEGPSS